MDSSRRRFFRRQMPRVEPFRPPWSMPERQFIDACQRCDDCVRACPTGLLKRGDGGFPEADFAAAACNFCGDCAAACTSGALSRSAVPEPWQFSIHIDERCLALQRIDCRICGEQCDTRAIRFQPVIGGVPRPLIETDVCTGCGACLAPCPTAAIVRGTTGSMAAVAVPPVAVPFSPFVLAEPS